MTENRLSRECYLKENTVPTISVIQKHMGPTLADVYFKSMNQKLKVITGLEPPLKGGGNNWYVPPKDLLAGRAILKPINAKYLKQLGWRGLDEIAMKKIALYHSQMVSETEQALHEEDERWKDIVKTKCEVHYQHCSEIETKAISKHIEIAFTSFVALYKTSLTKLEAILVDAAVKKIKETQSKTQLHMQIKYEDLLQKQSDNIVNKYTNKLSEEKEILKDNFIRDLEKTRATFYNKLHDINLEKNVAVEKLRHFLECQTRGCQIYVAMKEREEYSKERNSAKHNHSKKSNTLTKKIHIKELHIRHAEQKKKKQAEFMQTWQKKVCRIVKNFQMFILYCLKMMPEQADFFINMEKLMLVQLNESLEDPSLESCFEIDFQPCHEPEPNPHPFYIYCEKNNKPHVRKELCPKHCTSSASQFPVIVINKHCIYANCDNFKQCSDKIKDDGNITSDTSSEDDYSDFAIPVKNSRSQQLQELKLESSIMQVLEQEIANIQNGQFICPVCKIPCYPECNCSVSHSSVSIQSKKKFESLGSLESTPSISVTKQEELAYTRGSTMESYMKYVQSNRCNCSKLAKMHLMEHLPAYMRNMSNYNALESLSYKPCSALEVKTLVQIEKGKKDRHPKTIEPKTKEVACQYTDFDYKYLCHCFSKHEIENILLGSLPCNIQSDSWSGSYPLKFQNISASSLMKVNKSFVEARILSLRRLVESSEVRALFQRIDCNFSE